jgi:hypothetical protein
VHPDEEGESPLAHTGGLFLLDRLRGRTFDYLDLSVVDMYQHFGQVAHQTSDRSLGTS